MEETESFTKKEKAKESAMRTLMRHPKELMTVVGLTMGGTLAFYTYTTYMQKYLVNTVGMSISDSTTISAATLFLFMCLQPLVGGLSDKIGRRPILIAFGVLGTLFTVPILTTLHTSQHLVGRVLPDHGGADHRQRLHLDQRGGQSRTVPDRNPRAGRWPAVRTDRVDLRRHR